MDSCMRQDIKERLGKELKINRVRLKTLKDCEIKQFITQQEFLRFIPSSSNFLQKIQEPRIEKACYVISQHILVILYLFLNRSDKKKFNVNCLFKMFQSLVNRNLPEVGRELGTFLLDLLCEPPILAGVYCEDVS